MNNAMRYLGLARKAGHLEVGEENVGTAVRLGKAKLVVLAADSSENARSRARGFLYGKKTPLLTLPFSKEDISLALGKNGCSMAAFTDIGLASSFVTAMAQDAPDTYEEIAQLLRAKNERSKQRMAESKAQSGNKKTGKRRRT